MTAVTPALLQDVVELCQRAGTAIMEVYRRPSGFTVHEKADNSPLTAADMAAHELLADGLTALLDVPVLSEESAIPSFDVRRQWQCYWLVDPLDGTKEFISGNGEFTVNVALIEQGIPRLGVVHVPVSAITYTGAGKLGATKITDAKSERLCIRQLSSLRAMGHPVEVVLSRRHGIEQSQTLVRHLEEYFGTIASRDVGSSLKLCLVAEGKADLYPRLAPTSEWDTAAAQAVVEAAGGKVLDGDLSPMRYNQKDSLINASFYVIGDPSAPWLRLLSSVKDTGAGQV